MKRKLLVGVGEEWYIPALMYDHSNEITHDRVLIKPTMPELTYIPIEYCSHCGQELCQEE